METLVLPRFCGVGILESVDWLLGWPSSRGTLSEGFSPMAILGDRDVDRTILPCPSPPSGSVAGCTMQESMYSPRLTTSRLPDDAPSILIILIDDGGWCCTPRPDRPYPAGCHDVGGVARTGRAVRVRLSRKLQLGWCRIVDGRNRDAFLKGASPVTRCAWESDAF